MEDRDRYFERLREKLDRIGDDVDFELDDDHDVDYAKLAEEMKREQAENQPN